MVGRKLLSDSINLKFNGKWRDYQWRVLCELDNYLDDKKLNIVAAPGAGKTTLGIEVLRRLDKPTLILAPTITIRNQWKNRICEAFVENKEQRQNISINGNEIKPITILTYQLLHSIIKKNENKNSFIKLLKIYNINTVVLDEAHHLRTEWYKSLIELCNQLDNKDFTTVSLTGTPPYDVSPQEWQNYHTLCGPVDAEISIPELVKQGDLCKHQDLIYFSKLEIDEQQIVDEFNKNRYEFLKYLKTDSDFSYSIKTSNFIAGLEQNLDVIYEDTEFILSIISFLIENDDLDTTALTLLNYLELNREQIPKFDFIQANYLTNGILGRYVKDFKNIPVIKGKLKELNLLESSNKADLLGTQNQRKVFSRSTSKIHSVKDISDVEYQNLGDDLREVVLLDYIGINNRYGINILSVFDILKNNKYKVGILTGTLIVIPQSAKEAIQELLKQHKIELNNVLLTEYVEHYLRVETYGSIDIVSIITELFNNGNINILIGTQALLGEGWDSPCVNTLIIASIVGSFMLSNQMRGRALRVDKKDLDKISNVWHLATISKNEFQDFEAIKRRFNTFEGISYIDNTIQNQLTRLNINERDLCNININKLNEVQLKRAQERNYISEKWHQIFKESALTEQNMTSKFVHKYILGQSDTPILQNIYDVIQLDKLEIPERLVKHRNNYFVKNIILPIYTNKKFKEKYAKKHIFLKNLIMCLSLNGIIKTSYKLIEIKNILTDDFLPYITILNCTNYERKLIIDVLTEMFSQPTNQRYLLRFEDTYLTVPDCIGTHRGKVEGLRYIISEAFGLWMDIIYTRNEIGKKLLLNAKYSQCCIDKSIKTGRLWI